VREKWQRAEATGTKKFTEAIADEIPGI